MTRHYKNTLMKFALITLFSILASPPQIHASAEVITESECKLALKLIKADPDYILESSPENPLRFTNNSMRNNNFKTALQSYDNNQYFIIVQFIVISIKTFQGHKLCCILC